MQIDQTKAIERKTFINLTAHEQSLKTRVYSLWEAAFIINTSIVLRHCGALSYT